MKTIAALLASFAVVVTSYAQNTPWPASGDVGIGTTSPNDRLEVNGAFRISGTSSFVAGVSRLYNNSNLGFVQSAGTGSIYDFYLADRGGSILLANPANSNTLVLANSGGNVGIGTTTPGYNLDVHGTIGSVVSSGSNIFLVKPLGASISFQDGTNQNALLEANSSSNALEFWTNTSTNSGLVQRMTINNLGNVGIGTTAPNAKLEIEPSGVNVGIRLKNTGSNTNWDLYAYSDGNFYLNNANGSVVNIIANAQANLLYLSGGNVGIGTTSPTEKLSVNGKIRAREVIVENTGWSDYVFADDYKLPSLADVEAQIKTNKHLPGVPSAQDVSEKGVSIGDMQAVLLAKIEELTLHQIAQEKRLSAQGSRIEALEAENAQLKSQQK